MTANGEETKPDVQFMSEDKYSGQLNISQRRVSFKIMPHFFRLNKQLSFSRLEQKKQYFEDIN